MKNDDSPDQFRSNSSIEENSELDAAVDRSRRELLHLADIYLKLGYAIEAHEILDSLHKKRQVEISKRISETEGSRLRRKLSLGGP